MLSAFTGLGETFYGPSRHLATHPHPRAMVALPEAGKIAVVHGGPESSHILAVVGVEQGEVERQIPILAGLHSSVATDGAGEYVYVANDHGGTVTRCELATGILRHETFGKRIFQVLTVAGGERMLVLSESAEGRFELTSLQVGDFAVAGTDRRRLALDDGSPSPVCPSPLGLPSAQPVPGGMVAEASGQKVYIVSTMSPEVLPTSPPPARLSATAPILFSALGDRGFPLPAVAPERGPDWLQVLQVEIATLTISATYEYRLGKLFRAPGPAYSTRTIVPQGLALAADEGLLFVAHPGWGILALDRRDGRAKWSLDRADSPTGIAGRPPTDSLLVSCRSANLLLAVETATGNLRWQTASGCEDPLAILPDNRSSNILVAGTFADGIAVLTPQPTSTPEPSVVATTPNALQERILFHGRIENQTTLCTLAPDGTDLRYHLKTTGSLRHPLAAADGTKIAFKLGQAGRGDVFLMDLATQAVSRVTSAGPHGLPDALDVHGFAWYPDGSRLAVTFQRTHRDHAIYTIRLDGTGQMLLVDNYGDHDVFPAIHPFDPDIVLYCYDAGNWVFDRELRYSNRFTGMEGTLVPNNGKGVEAPLVLRDGSVACVSTEGGWHTPRTLCRVSPVDGACEVIARAPNRNCEFSALHPDGKRILRYVNEPFIIDLVDLDSGTTTHSVPLPFDAFIAVQYALLPQSFLDAPPLEFNPDPN